ncbi:MAG: hypothetical protein Udaeo2_04910 [Candidatus Udaeobacter sp.]|nr:MAG: hypothetical protein Udaeo2_04910 [Candidatus Udaeobacter sp.]
MALQRRMQIINLARAVQHPLARIPAGIKFSGTDNRLRALGHRQLCVENRAADFQVRIERFARNEQPHDFARAFENSIDAAISKKSLYCNRRLASSRKRLRSFVAATAAHLHRLVGNSPGRFGCPHFAHGSFDAQIARLPIQQRGCEKCHRFHGKNIAGHLGDLSCDCGMFADRHAPLDAFACPFA